MDLRRGADTRDPDRVVAVSAYRSGPEMVGPTASNHTVLLPDDFGHTHRRLGKRRRAAEGPIGTATPVVMSG